MGELLAKDCLLFSRPRGSVGVGRTQALAGPTLTGTERRGLSLEHQAAALGAVTHTKA